MNALKILQSALSSIGVPVYPIVVPQSAGLPCIVTSMVSERATPRLDDTIGQYEAVCRVACHGATPAASMDLGETVKNHLLLTVQSSLNGQNVLVNIFKGTTDLTDYDDNRTVFRRIIDFRVQWWA